MISALLLLADTTETITISGVVLAVVAAAGGALRWFGPTLKGMAEARMAKWRGEGDWPVFWVWLVAKVVFGIMYVAGMTIRNAILGEAKGE